MSSSAMPALYQVHVETRAGSLIPIGPRWTKQAAERLVVAINRKIAEGVEREWSNPHIVATLPRSN